jgi:hypothetical protein
MNNKRKKKNTNQLSGSPNNKSGMCFANEILQKKKKTQNSSAKYRK